MALTKKFNSPIEAFLYWEQTTPNNVFIKQRIAGKTIKYTFEQVGTESRKIASYIRKQNLPSRSHIALLSKNCAHWYMSDLAIMMSGHVSIPIYPTLNAESIRQILEHSESKLLIVGKLDNYAGQQPGITDIPVVGVNMYGDTHNLTWEDVVSAEEELQDIYEQQSHDLFTIIYTSGTTGTPKGVMHTVGNFIVCAYSLNSVFDIEEQANLFSYLPIAHVAERVLENVAILLGACITFPESLDTFASDLEHTQPRAFFAVPRIWSKFQEKILEKIPQKKLSTLLLIPIINSILKKKLQKKLGLGNAKILISAAAPIAPSLVKWYQKLGIHIYQLYGMTEDCVISHTNRPGLNKVGTVGKVQNGVETKLTAEGEICIKNNCLMKGYFKAPEMTAEMFDEDGFFKTGDTGEYDHDGFLTLTGRVKDQFKTDKGKYISPAHIELKMVKNTNIEQICVVGMGIPQPIALITLSELGRSKNKQELCDGLIATMAKVNQGVEKHERVEKVVIMKEDWNVENGLTTPTLKVKRNSIEKIHQPYYKSWFDSSDKVIFE